MKIQFPRERDNQSASASQRSIESLSQYEHLENVYAPSATPCYDTPVHNADAAPPPDPEKMCYLDLNIENEHKLSDEDAIKPTEESQQQRPDDEVEDNSEQSTGKREDKT